MTCQADSPSLNHAPPSSTYKVLCSPPSFHIYKPDSIYSPLPPLQSVTLRKSCHLVSNPSVLVKFSSWTSIAFFRTVPAELADMALRSLVHCHDHALFGRVTVKKLEFLRYILGVSPWLSDRRVCCTQLSFKMILIRLRQYQLGLLTFRWGCILQSSPLTLLSLCPFSWLLLDALTLSFFYLEGTLSVPR